MPAAKQACISSSPSAPAGRSRKHAILPKRRTRSIPLKPPLFSLEEVLGATFPPYTDGNSAPTCGYGGLTVERAGPSWFFDIYEDMPEEEMMNLLQHSTCTLGINGNEECELTEEHNKENHPVHGSLLPHVASTHHQSNVTNSLVVREPRSLLVELNITDYYAPGYDYLSFVTVAGSGVAYTTEMGCNDQGSGHYRNFCFMI